jgi:hypothetical protein
MVRWQWWSVGGQRLARVRYPIKESSLYTIAKVGITLAGFSGLVVAFQRRDLKSWSPPQYLNFLFLITNSLLVVLYSLLPIPLLIWGLPAATIWTLCSLLMAAYFLGGDVFAIRFTLRHRQEFARREVPPGLYLSQWALLPVATLMGIVMLLSAADLLIPRGQAPYVLGLTVLLVFAGIQFACFAVLGRQTGAT